MSAQEVDLGHLPDRYSKCAVCGIMRDLHDRVPSTTATHIFRSEGLELQRGLEAAVEWERSQVGHGPNELPKDGCQFTAHSDHECEFTEGHVGHTNDF